MATLIDSYSETNQNDYFHLGYLSRTRVGQCFTSSITTFLSNCSFNLEKTGSATGNITAQLYAMTGVYGTSGKPTGLALATSDTVDVSTISSTNFVLTTFNFTGANQIIITPGYYCIAVDYPGANASNHLKVGEDSSSPTASGNGFLYTGTYTATPVDDVCFYIYGNNTLTNSNFLAFM